MKSLARIGLTVTILVSLCADSYGQIDPSWEYFHYNQNGTRGAGAGFLTIDIRLSANYSNDPGRQYYLSEGSTFSWRRTSNGGPLTNTYYAMAGFNSSNYTQGQLRSVGQWQGDVFRMNYRLLFPRNYDSNPNVEGGYPMIVMIHGFGERGNCWDNNCYHSNRNWDPNANSPAAPWNENELLNNDHSMTHGGSVHQTAVRTTTPAGMVPDDPNMPARAFPGFVLFPQNLNGWAHWDNPDESVVRIIRLLIQKYNINPNKIYIHGLSDGGAGALRVVRCAPWLFAAALPMSAVNGAETNEYDLYPYIESIPLWYFQGGTDGNPRPRDTEARIDDFRNQGMDVRYTLYPPLGHGVWNNAYAEPDFFSWMRSKDKSNIHVRYGKRSVCSTSGASADLVLAQGFRAYQWEKDGELIPGATSYSYSATLPGTYRARFSRVPNPGESDWNRWSDPVVITESAPPKPSILTSGSTTFPTLDGQATVVLKASEKNDKYYWYRNGNLVTDARTFDDVYSDIQDTLSMIWRNAGSHAGTYTLRTSDLSGCQSVSSDPVYIANNASLTLTAPSNFTGVAQGSSSIFLSWTDNSPNETGFEIWRRKAGETAFAFVTQTSEDAVSYLDGNLTSGTTYHYKIRAVGNTTRSNYAPSNDTNVNGTGSLVVTTAGDTVEPTPPQNLEVTENSTTTISLSWDTGSDNVGVRRYKVNYGGSSVLTASAETTYTIGGLTVNNVFPITVQTEDFEGNLSPPSNQVIGTTYVEGLHYEHSTGAWTSANPATSAAKGDNPPIDWVTAEFTGKVSVFPSNIRDLSTQEEFFKFKFDGYLNIAPSNSLSPPTVSNHYQFRLTSDDGSMMFIGGFDPDDVTQFRVINNDGLHGNTTVPTGNIALAPGFHRIVVLFFEYTGGQTLTVQYRRRTGSGTSDANYTSWANIPSSMLRSGTYNPPTAPSAPTSLAAVAGGMTSINLSWSYGGGGGAESEVYRGLASNGDFAVVGRANGLTFTDETVLPGTTYYYKLKTVVATGTSNFSNTAQATTVTDNAAPSAPGGLALNSKTFSNVAFSWAASTDNVGVTGYEVSIDATIVDTVSVTSYMATDLEPGTQYVFTVKAIDVSGNRSTVSAPLVVTTNSGVVYYSKANGALNSPATWGTNSDGSGAAPASLDHNGNIYTITRPNTGLGGQLVIGGSVSKVIVQSGTTLNVDNNMSARIEIQGNGVVNLNNSTANLQFVSVSPTSTVNFQAYTNIPAATYGNVNLGSTSGNKNFEEGETIILGNLTAPAGAALKGAPSNASRVVVHGDISLSGTPGDVASDNALDLVLAKTGTQTFTLGGTLDLYRISTSPGANVNVVNGGTPATIHIGSPNGGGLALADGTTLNLGNNHLVMKNAASINPAGETGRLAVNGSNLDLTSSSGQHSNLHFDDVAHTAGFVTCNFLGSGNLLVHSPVRITDGLKIKAGTVNSGGNITLVSTQAKTAYLQEIEGNGSITGVAHVERWVSPTAKYRYMSSAVAGMTVANWQTYMPITGPFTGADSNSPNASMFYFVENDGGYKNFPPTGGDNQVTLTRGRGYSVYNWNGSNALTLTMSGTPYQGSVPYTLTPGTAGNDGWNLVGNPYASAIQWNNLASDWTRSGVSPVAYVPDNTGGSLSFRTWDASTNQGTLAGGIIAPGQAFWVQTSTANPSMTVHEKAKRTSSSTFFREKDTPTNSITIRLSNGSREDAAFVILDEAYSDNYEPDADGMKRRNDVLNLSTRSAENIKLVFNKLSDSFCEKTVPLVVEDVTPGAYALTFENIENLVGIGEVTLVDHFTNNSVTLTGSERYNFAVTADAASYGSERFAITFNRPALQKTAVATAEDICGGDMAAIQLNNTQPGVFYYAAIGSDETALSEVLTGDGGSLTLNVPVSHLQAGANNVVVRMGFKGCQNELLSPAPLEFNYTPSPQVVVERPYYSLCPGSQVTLKASTDAGNILRWYQDGKLLVNRTDASWLSDPIETTTNFEVAAVVNGCEGARVPTYVEINPVPLPRIEFDGEALEIVNDLPQGVFIQWYKDHEPIDAYDRGVVLEDEGTYSVLVSKGGCSQLSEEFDYLTTGTEERHDGFNAYVYPNPGTWDELYLKLQTNSTRDAHVQLADVAGRTVLDMSIKGSEIHGTYKLEVSQDTAPGLYILHVRQGEAVLKRKVILYYR